jgi:vancomycin aglycone glucosyltransferase
MKILISAVGTRGDIQPALALALELKKRNHSVRMCISPNFLDWAQNLGLDALPMGVEMRMPSQKSVTPPKLTPEELKRLQASMPDLITDQFEVIGEASKNCDIIIGANAHQYAAPSIAERMGIHCITAVYSPTAIPSLSIAPPPIQGQNSTADISIAEQWLISRMMWNERALNRINQNRERLGLTPISDVLDYVLTDHTWLAADAILAPLQPIPERNIFQSGTWVLPDDTPLPAKLNLFIENGDPPVLIGFGSMPASGDIARHIVEALYSHGKRIIVMKGWADLDIVEEAQNCIVIEEVNYNKLLPLVTAIIHHGGAGTTAAAARAGIPQIITPMFSDQFYWGNRVNELGIGVTKPYASVTMELMEEYLEKVIIPDVQGRARRLAGQVRNDGAELAAKQLDHYY